MAAQPRDRTDEERDRAMAAVRELICWIGDNPDREGLTDTPTVIGERLCDLLR